MSVATLQTQLSEARTATSELDGPSVYSPDFDAGRWKMRISLLSDEGAGSQSCDFFLCPTASLAQKITLSYNLQFRTDVPNSPKVWSDESCDCGEYVPDGQGWGFGSVLGWSMIDALPSSASRSQAPSRRTPLTEFRRSCRRTWSSRSLCTRATHRRLHGFRSRSSTARAMATSLFTFPVSMLGSSP
ncbi:hypothetical protein BJY59DRAFT_222879 [Rhodotorula toruloides]